MAGWVRVVIGAGVLLSFLSSPAAQAPQTHNGIHFRFGWFAPSGDSQVWDDNQAAFTLSPSDFDDFIFGFGFVRSLNNNVELGFTMDFYEEVVLSGYDDWVDSAGFAILHDTRLELVPLRFDFRFLPAGRYAIRGSAGQRRLLQAVPYLGLGAGFQFWEYEEVGDFLNFSPDPANPRVFPGRFVDDGVEPEFHVLAGVELPLGPNAGIVFEGVYSWSETELAGDFQEMDLGDLDLGGFSITLGFVARF
jgi:hypothetical protein